MEKLIPASINKIAKLCLKQNRNLKYTSRKRVSFTPPNPPPPPTSWPAFLACESQPRGCAEGKNMQIGQYLGSINESLHVIMHLNKDPRKIKCMM